ncbi:MAG: 50S ribosomal protein L3 N(5)-glutamine methyltransferase [Pseudomonadota bacterium]
MLASPDSLIQEFRTIADFVRWGATEFARANLHFGHGTDNPLDESLSLVLHSLNLTHDIPESLLQTNLLETEKRQIVDLLSKRIVDRVPAPYLTGSSQFMGLQFKVDQRVLIPRSPIAELIEKEFAPWLVGAPDSILDLCTGSGCIAIACAYVFPDATVHGTDISEDALQVAQDNVMLHGLERRVTLSNGDLFNAVADQKFDLIVSNPPYVGDEEIADLPAEYRHEPGLALRSGTDGLQAVTSILTRASQHLNPDGLLVIEVGNTENTLIHQFPTLAATWVELEHGGSGVFVIDKNSLDSQRFFAS